MEKEIKSATGSGQNQPIGYLEAIKMSFFRVWERKKLWIWGIFLPAGSLFFFDSSQPESKREAERFSDISQIDFAVIATVIIAILVIAILWWIISAIVRPGVIRTLDRVQGDANTKITHPTIWREGKERFIQVLKLDLLMFFAIVMIMIALAILAVVIYMNASLGLVILLSIIIFLATILVLVLIGFIRAIGVVYISLGTFQLREAIRQSYDLILNNKREVLKLFLSLFLISLVGGAGIFLVLVSVFAFLILIWGILVSLLGMNFINIILIVVIGLAFVVAVFLVRAIMALWSHDFIIWWVKMINGARIKQEEETVEEEERASANETSSEPELA